MKVYVLTVRDPIDKDSTYELEAVFATKELAEEYKATRCKGYKVQIFHMTVKGTDSAL